MVLSAVRENHDGVRVVKSLLVFHPAHLGHLDNQPRHARKALLQEQSSGVIFMHAGRMAGFAGNKDELLFAIRRDGESCGL